VLKVKKMREKGYVIGIKKLKYEREMKEIIEKMCIKRESENEDEILKKNQNTYQQKMMKNEYKDDVKK
jgi:hypothetical protein